MSSLGGHFSAYPNASHSGSGPMLFPNGTFGASSRSRTPIPTFQQSAHQASELETASEDDPRSQLFNDLFKRAEARLSTLFSGKSDDKILEPAEQDANTLLPSTAADGQLQKTKALPKKAARTIDEDDYDDSDGEDSTTANNSPLKSKSTGSTVIPSVVSPAKPIAIPPSPALTSVQGSTSQWQGKSTEDIRKSLEENKKSAEEAAKRSFMEYFYPLDNDRDTMLEQQRLEESDRQVDVEMSGQANAAPNANEGTLSQANLGTSSLVLKHLIARIDAKRDMVKASDHELRNLMIEVKKNRSKWASEDKVGQEELYEAADKVLSEIKAQTEHSQPFLQRVNKREAPDYYQVIRHPMDLSTMTKKLKQLQYKSKQDFVNDLNLIWTNCLKYNADPQHFLRRHALAMRKLSEGLVPLIPDVVIRDRAEVEAEERRLHAAEGDLEGAEDSDDEPIISSRGRKAPSKTAAKGSNARKAPASGVEVTPGADVKPLPNGNSGRYDFPRADSDAAMDGSQNGFSTPPPGTHTPAGLNGVTVSSQADPMDVDVFASSAQAGSLNGPHVDYDDPQYKVWKQVTKKDRAVVAAERHRLFKGDKLNPEEPALLRSKAGMRRWVRKQRGPEENSLLGKRKREGEGNEDAEPTGETLAEGMEDTEEKVLPDYYDTMSAIPDLNERLQWTEDSEDGVAPAIEETLRVVPSGFFTAPQSTLFTRMESNMRQIQETRKVCSKIGIVKQMQLQSQMYQNQFQRYELEPFVERDIETHVVSDDGPVMTPYICRAALQRSVAKIFFNAGFEECQPSALDAATDIASGYFQNIARVLGKYLMKPRVSIDDSIPIISTVPEQLKPKYSLEESVLQALNENGIELESLEMYAKDEADRVSGKLDILHERMKAHLAELLRPALASDAGPDGVNAFNDGSEQFVGGDFAEDLDEDFFGFKELGLDKEFGLASLSVPLHLLQNRMHSAYQSQNQNTSTATANTFPAPPPLPAVTLQSLSGEIGLIQNFFLAKLHANSDQPLIEDEDLPQKQRLPKPRLPPTGKITSPRKKPVREAGPGKGHPKKKMRHVEGQGWVKESDIIEKEKAVREEKQRVAKQDQKTKGTPATRDRSESRDADGEADEDTTMNDIAKNG